MLPQHSTVTTGAVFSIRRPSFRTFRNENSRPVHLHTHNIHSDSSPNGMCTHNNNIQYISTGSSIDGYNEPSGIRKRGLVASQSGRCCTIHCEQIGELFFHGCYALHRNIMPTTIIIRVQHRNIICHVRIVIPSHNPT